MSPSDLGRNVSDNPTSDARSWYKYCGDLAGRIADAYGQGYEPTNLIQQYEVCEQIVACQSHQQQPFGLIDPCVPSYDPPIT